MCSRKNIWSEEKKTRRKFMIDEGRNQQDEHREIDRAPLASTGGREKFRMHEEKLERRQD